MGAYYNLLCVRFVRWHWSTKILSHEEKCLFLIFFWRWIQICFHNFSIIHTYRSRLKGWNLLRQYTKVCFYLGRHEVFKDFFSQECGVVFCNDVCYVMEVLGHECNTVQWRLFIHSSNESLKVVLLRNGNRFPSVPLAHEGKLPKHKATVGKD